MEILEEFQKQEKEKWRPSQKGEIKWCCRHEARIVEALISSLTELVDEPRNN